MPAPQEALPVKAPPLGVTSGAPQSPPVEAPGLPAAPQSPPVAAPHPAGSGRTSGSAQVSSGGTNEAAAIQHTSGSKGRANVQVSSCRAIDKNAKQSTKAVIFKVEFFNGAATNPPYGINEPVSGTFNSIVQAATADSSVTINGTAHDSVVLTDPVGLTTRPLS